MTILANHIRALIVHHQQYNKSNAVDEVQLRDGENHGQRHFTFSVRRNTYLQTILGAEIAVTSPDTEKEHISTLRRGAHFNID